MTSLQDVCPPFFLDRQEQLWLSQAYYSEETLSLLRQEMDYSTEKLQNLARAVHKGLKMLIKEDGE